MSSNQEQELCTATVDSPEPIEVCCQEENTNEETLETAPELTIEPIPDQAADADLDEQVPELDPQETTDADPITTATPCPPPGQCKIQTIPQLMESRIPKAVIQYYLQFGFSSPAVHALLHSLPKDIADQKVSFTPTTPPKNC